MARYDNKKGNIHTLSTVVYDAYHLPKIDENKRGFFLSKTCVIPSSLHTSTLYTLVTVSPFLLVLYLSVSVSVYGRPYICFCISRIRICICVYLSFFLLFHSFAPTRHSKSQLLRARINTKYIIWASNGLFSVTVDSKWNEQ